MGSLSAEVPESILGREIFGSLGGIIELGAVVATGTYALPDVSVGDFVARYRNDLDGILAAVQQVGDYGDFRGAGIAQGP